MMDFEIASYAMMKEALARICGELERENVPEDVVFGSRLAFSELVVNALRYGGGKAYVRAEYGEREVRFWVRGEKRFVPPERSERPPERSERGRGLFLVDALCDRREYSEERGIGIVFLVDRKG